MKKNNMMKSAVLMMLAAMAINSCSTSKNVNKEIKDENQVARPGNDMDMDEQYLTLSDAQLDILQKNNKFAFNLFQKVSGMDSKVVSPMSVSYLMGMLANGADGVFVGQLLIVPLSPVAAEVLAGHLLGLLQCHGGLGVLQSRDDAGGLFQQIRPDGLLPVDQQHAVAAHVAPAGGGDERRPLFHRLALVAGEVHPALLHHPIEGREAVVPLPGDLDLVGGDGLRG